MATPVRAVAAEARRALGAGGGLVTDVGGVKASIVEAVGDARFVGGHPMAGSEQEGVDGADADLFEGATWVLTPTEGTDAAAYAQVRQIVGTLGAEVVALPPDRHDELVAVVSHVPHLTAATLMRLADERSEEHRALLRLAAGGFRDMTRIAAGHPGIWPDICSDNREAIVEVLDGLDGRWLRTCGTWWRSTTARAAGRWSRPSRPGSTCRPGSAPPPTCARSASRCPTARAWWPTSPSWPPTSTSTSSTSRSPTPPRAPRACWSC